MHFKGGQTLKNILVSPKDKVKIANKNSVIYSYSCGKIDCDEEYIGESGRTFGEGFKEHLKAQSQNSYIRVAVAMKQLWRTLKSLEEKKIAWLYIRVNNPSLNRNTGKYNIPHIWDKILLTIPELKMK